MNSNNILNLIDDPVLPELMPEEHIYDDLFQMNDLMIPPPHSEIIDLNRKFDSLTLTPNLMPILTGCAWRWSALNVSGYKQP